MEHISPRKSYVRQLHNSAKNGHTVWKGEMTAHLVRVMGDLGNGSPRRLHSEKDVSGQPITKTVELWWELDKFSNRP